ncbi:MAG: sigma-54 dependent transcriptional regulator [Chitinophagales bacterium]|nr:sigma-54 dependent transcriptional regulator [Chitinophagales bacterium]MCZ2394822.1 sigma-54 dependent transcriptional regulator [Chitinophagales bacterium]
MDLQAVKQRFQIIGNSAKLNHALEVAIRVANTDLSVLITGESGVGKEIFSQIIHLLSIRKHEDFIAVNCGAIPEGTIDSELFGHEKGSFTGAHEKRKGYFESVNRGTIFLDEIGELPIGTQARLLRLLESGEFIKVGSSIVQKTDVRILAATNVNLQKLVQQGKFREDLYYRLNTVPILVPPLRERKEDIPILFRKFCVDFSDKYNTSPIQLTDDARHLLVQYNWPGNVRQLKNIAEQASVLAKQKLVDINELAGFLPQGGSSNQLPIIAKEDETLMSDREILYKMIFDIKNDLNDLKRFVWSASNAGGTFNVDENISHPKFEVPTTPSVPVGILYPNPTSEPTQTINKDNNYPYIVDDNSTYEEQSVDQTLSISDMEKDLIDKALKKHKGKRKDAAFDLGISERTLYRKIKDYEINA